MLLLASMLAGFSAATSSYPTQVVTSYSYSTVPISTVTSTSTGQQNLLTDTIALQPAGFHYCGEYDVEDFTASAGSISGTVTSDHPIDVYLVSNAVLTEWIKAASCDGPSQVLYARTQTTNYNFTANLPSSGEYEILFLNHSHDFTANIVITVNSAETEVTWTATSYSMLQQTFFSTESMSLQEELQTSSSSGFGNSLLMFGVIAAIAIALVAIVLMRRGKAGKETPRTKVGEPETTAAKVQEREGSMFCRKCGAKIPRDSTFCKECGEKTKA